MHQSKGSDLKHYTREFKSILGEKLENIRDSEKIENIFDSTILPEFG